MFIAVIVAVATLSVVTALVLRSPAYGRLLQDRWTLALFVSLPITWLFLLTWASAFGGLTSHNAAWVSWPVVAVLLGFPVLAALLIGRAKGARTICAAFVLLNIPCWLASCFIAGMATTGEYP